MSLALPLISLTTCLIGVNSTTAAKKGPIFVTQGLTICTPTRDPYLSLKKGLLFHLQPGMSICHSKRAYYLSPPNWSVFVTQKGLPFVSQQGTSICHSMDQYFLLKRLPVCFQTRISIYHSKRVYYFSQQEKSTCHSKRAYCLSPNKGSVVVAQKGFQKGYYWSLKGS